MLEDPDVQFVTVRGLKLAYRETGSPDNPPMVLLHGLAETSAFFWRPLIARFVDHYHIIAFDLLGHGDSDAPARGYEVERQADLFRRAIRKLNLNRVVLVGHSLGGVIAARLAINAPRLIERLVLYDAPLSAGPRQNIMMFGRNVPFTAIMLMGSAVLPQRLARIALSLIPLRLTTRMILRRWRVPYDDNRLNNEFLDHAVRNSGLALMQCARSAYIRHNLIRDVKHLRVPTCMIVGDSDLLLPVESAQRIAKLLPNCTLAIIEEASHVALIDQPEQFNQALEQFLSA